jgi:hypothetical protein
VSRACGSARVVGAIIIGIAGTIRVVLYVIVYRIVARICRGIDAAGIIVAFEKGSMVLVIVVIAFTAVVTGRAALIVTAIDAGFVISGGSAV